MLDYRRLAFSCFFTLNLNTMIVEVYLCKTNSESLISTSSDERSATTS